ncbi:hypothetical protein HOY34_17345 [Xinfangfangia sp. D13-10-4-6]|uniref:hypothetical protein n=1 Tax=Pseudogemmobacter hezensis TaxID=2737662 RepID=UPI0015567E9E|nr:hypothetical protein [Pseudogemmobacter hezensis]NPD16960.1 hypothetical protein [Pseudogemmobacter hezensis]
MSERLEAILPQVPVEGIVIHIGKAGIGMGDLAEARLLPDGRVGIFAVIRQRVLGIFPTRRMGYIGHLGPVAERILSPALIEGLLLRLRIVVLTPEHLATNGPPEIHVSVWADPQRLAPWLDLGALYVPPLADDQDRDQVSLTTA